MPAQGGFLSEHNHISSRCRRGRRRRDRPGDRLAGAPAAACACSCSSATEPGGGTSHVAAGMLAPIAEARPAEEPLLELGLRSAARLPGVRRRAGRRPPGRTSATPRCGTLLVARDDDEAEALERELALRRRYGLAVERLRASEARRLEPALAPALRLALDVPDDHAIDPRAPDRGAGRGDPRAPAARSARAPRSRGARASTRPRRPG